MPYGIQLFSRWYELLTNILYGVLFRVFLKIRSSAPFSTAPPDKLSSPPQLFVLSEVSSHKLSYKF